MMNLLFKKFRWFDLGLFLLLGPFFPTPAAAYTTVTTANAYMVENTSGTDPSGNVCYDFQTRPSCNAVINGLSSGSLPPGSSNYIQNTLTPTTATQVFSVSTANITTALLLNNSAGNAGQSLTSNGPGVAPTYQSTTNLLPSTNTWSGSNNFTLTPTASFKVGNSSTNTCGYLIGSTVKIQSFNTIITSVTTSNTYGQAGLSGSFTPLCASDKIRLTGSGELSDSQTAACDCQTTFFRNPGGSQVDLAPSAGKGLCYVGDGGVASGISYPCFMQAYDSPGTVSATTYTVMMRIGAGSGTCTLTNHGVSTLNLEEIAQ